MYLYSFEKVTITTEANVQLKQLHKTAIFIEYATLLYNLSQMALHLSRSCGRRFCECLYDFDNATVDAAADAPAVSKNVNGIEGRNLLLLFLLLFRAEQQFQSQWARN
jgi:hypothetical protein